MINIEEIVKRILSEQLCLHEDEINNYETIIELGGDELDIIRITMELEDELEIEILDEELEENGYENMTVATLIEIVINSM